MLMNNYKEVVLVVAAVTCVPENTLTHIAHFFKFAMLRPLWGKKKRRECLNQVLRPAFALVWKSLPYFSSLWKKRKLEIKLLSVVLVSLSDPLS